MLANRIYQTFVRHKVISNEPNLINGITLIQNMSSQKNLNSASTSGNGNTNDNASGEIQNMSSKNNKVCENQHNSNLMICTDSNSANTSGNGNTGRREQSGAVPKPRNPNQESINIQTFKPHVVLNPYAGSLFNFNVQSLQLQMLNNPNLHYFAPANVMYRSFSDTNVALKSLSSQNFHRQNSESSISSNKCKRKNIPSLRQWEKIKPQYNSNKDKPGFKFTLMSYNVLAQDLVMQHSYLYKNHNQNSLQWKIRWQNILKEIKAANPDVLCLQEVQESHIEDYNFLNTLGYQGLYKKRTTNCTDGCAIYYKTEVINLVENITVEYRQSDWPLLNRDNVAIIAKFSPKSHPEEKFIVSTTHLLYNPKREDVRLAQVQILLAEIDRIAFKAVTNGVHTYLPTIITGDFNAPPNSLVYKFITDGNLNLKYLLREYGNGLLPTSFKITDNCQHATLLKMRETVTNTTRKQEMQLIEIKNSEHNASKQQLDLIEDSSLYSSGQISHNFPMKSVYTHRSNSDNEATTYQDRWVTVDYIFYSGKKGNSRVIEDKIKLLQRFKLPTSSQLGKTYLPNQDLGSDHLSLIAKFKLEF